MVDGLVWDRRRAVPPEHWRLREQLNETQKDVLRILEDYGWQLGFVREDADLIPVVFATDSSLYAVIKADGSIEDRPELPMRH